MNTSTYDAQSIEAYWQAVWQQEKCDVATDTTDQNDTRPKYYCLSMFPYPSGQLHMGHVRNYTLSDVIARYKRMRGFNVLHPMGWDAFGMPAENAAIKHGRSPYKWTMENISHMREQLKRLGLSYDWQREFATCTPEYYRWEQWFFLQLLEKGMAYRANAPVNWCETCHTVLANEQVIDGDCWRCENAVIRKQLSQWFLRITDYADELLTDLEQLQNWPKRVVDMQRNWIGRSVGANVRFPLQDVLPDIKDLEIFTTRPDTLMGVTFMAIAAEHPLAIHAAKNNNILAEFIEECRHTATREADLATLDKKGMATGLYALHPITGASVPIWVANFVLMSYGFGAVMSVPAHDQRDCEFAKSYSLPIITVIDDNDTLINSGEFNDLSSTEAKAAIINKLTQLEIGEAKVQYRLRDWLVSRQRYWGTPIPIIHCPDCGIVPVPDNELPVLLPTDLHPTGGASLLTTHPDFAHINCPRCGNTDARRESDTFDTFVESSWYMERFTCSDAEQMLDADKVKKWLPVDQYIGGIEHAVLHLLYARFFHKLLRDAGLSYGDEPFASLLTQGMVLKDGVKMAKSRGNIIAPNDIIERFGADTARLFILFAAPPEKDLNWNEAGVEGAHRFLQRVWRLLAKVDNPVNTKPTKNTASIRDFRRQLHACIQKVTNSFERGFAFNVAIASMMELCNNIQDFAPADDVAINADVQQVLREAFEALTAMLVPFVPHFASSCHERLQLAGLAVNSPWPEVDQAALKRDTIMLVVQINGKKRGDVKVAVGCDEATAIQAVNDDERISRWLIDMKIIKTILVRGRLLNIVVRPS
ncbi:MAG: leucine--tRNA ligase [Mariprofundales bacterium]